MQLDMEHWNLHKVNKFFGLMFSKRKNVYFEFKKDGRYGVHTCFVFFPLMIYFLDGNKKVVDKVKLKPFRFYKPQNKCKYIVELSDF